MTAQPLHTIEVDHEIDEDYDDGRTTVTAIRFVCHAPRAVACKRYPACECEAWSGTSHFVEPYDRDNPTAKRTPQPGHEHVDQDDCWLITWFEAMDTMDHLEYGVLKGAGENGEDLEAWHHHDLVVTGPVQLVWSGEDEYYFEIGGDVDSLPEAPR